MCRGSTAWKWRHCFLKAASVCGCQVKHWVAALFQGTPEIAASSLDSLRPHEAWSGAKVWLVQGQQSIADAILVLPPYYLAGVTEEGIENFFRAILQESKLPVLLYNFPANTNSLISPEMYARLAQDFPLLRGIKNTFADIPLCVKFKEAAPHLQVAPLTPSPVL